ncbi:hypothetical protein, partial [Vibrio aestuarianus]|uniref:hypothetical protein n=1 Tax=Vibrio aestuarianus TaxID=28171 RepID=UPI00237D0608
RLSLKKWHWLLDIGECRTSQLNSGLTLLLIGLSFALLLGKITFEYLSMCYLYNSIKITTKNVLIYIQTIWSCR